MSDRNRLAVPDDVVDEFADELDAYEVELREQIEQHLAEIKKGGGAPAEEQEPPPASPADNQ